MSLNLQKIDQMFSQLPESQKLGLSSQSQKKPLQNLKIDEKLKPKIVSYGGKAGEINKEEEYEVNKWNDYEMLVRLRREQSKAAVLELIAGAPQH